MTDDWREQRALQDEIGRSIERPIIIDWCDYIVKCPWCGYFNAVFEHQVLRVSNELDYVQCSGCQNSVEVHFLHEVRR